LECRKLKKEKEEQEAAKAANPKPSTSNNASGTTSAKVTVASVPNDDIIHLFQAVARPSSCQGQGNQCELFASEATTVPHPSVEHMLKTQEELESQDLTEEWIIDSGASWIMCSHCDWFTQYSPLISPINIVLSDDSAIPATGVSCVPVHMCANDMWQPAVLQDILYVPALHGNLLSVLQLAHYGAEMHFKGKGCQILDQHKGLTCEGELCGNLYIMGIKAMHPVTARIAIVDEFPDEGEDLSEHTLMVCRHMSKASLDTWHCCLGHLHQDAILSMQKIGMVKSMDITAGKALTTPCEPCLKGKQTRAKIRKTTDDCADAVLGQIYSDVCGKYPPSPTRATSTS
jgi:hypothetical protein